MASHNWSKQVKAWLKDNAPKLVKLVTATTVRLVNSAVDGLNKTDTPAQRLAAFTTRLGDIDSWRAVRNAKTEVARTMNISSLAGGNAALDEGQNLTAKIWQSRKDNNVRKDHIKADGQVRDIDKDFNVGGEAAAHPLDPRLSAKNAINCRCRVDFIRGDRGMLSEQRVISNKRREAFTKKHEAWAALKWRRALGKVSAAAVKGYKSNGRAGALAAVRRTGPAAYLGVFAVIHATLVPLFAQMVLDELTRK